MDQGELRAGDADRERVAERLRIALDEGRLNLHEYDDRLRDAYAAKTYAELDRLLVDLPPTVPAARSQLVPAGAAAPAPDGRYPNATRRWLVTTWNEWASASAVCIGIWAVISLLAGHLTYFWPGWVAGPWGVFLLFRTISGLIGGEPQRWAARRARRSAERELRRQARRRDRE